MAMDISTYMQKHHLSDAMLDAMARPYEQGDYPPEDGVVFSGSHLDVVGKKRVTVVYACDKVQRANRMAARKGVKSSEIYRAALDEYLERHDLTLA